MSAETLTITPAVPARRRFRLLGSLATVAVAGTLAIGSGATFTSSSSNAASGYKAGTLEQTNSKADSAIFDAENLKPGDVVIGEVTITNSGTLPATYTLTQVAAVNGFVDPTNLTFSVQDVTTGSTVWSGTFGELTSVELGTWEAGEAHSFELVSQLKPTAGDDEQGMSASVELRWDGIQTEAETFRQ